MAFIESPRFPDDISYGAVGGPGYMTDVVTVNSGYEYRSQVWSQARSVYDVSHAARTQTQFNTLLKFFRAAQGRTHGFRFKDWLDYAVTTADGVLATGVGTGVPSYQLTKKYVTGSQTEYRAIYKPVSGTPIIYRNATPAVAGSGAGQYALSASGLVTFVADEYQGISSIAVGANTVFTLGSAFTTAIVGEYVYITNVDGTLGAALNNRAWLITDVTGLDVTVDAGNTTGLTYSSAGNAGMYPQAADALTWSGEFDVPVRFDTDTMPAEIISKSGTSYVVGWSGITLVEIRV
jgi:uncharacterized protein (TIGR02217 family)